MQNLRKKNQQVLIHYIHNIHMAVGEKCLQGRVVGKTSSTSSSIIEDLVLSVTNFQMLPTRQFDLLQRWTLDANIRDNNTLFTRKLYRWLVYQKETRHTARGEGEASVNYS